MTYEMSWLVTLAMVAVGITLGVVSSLFIQTKVPVLVWSVLVSGVFIIAAMAAVIAGYSWMFNDETRALVQEIALAAGITGVTFGSRSAG